MPPRKPFRPDKNRDRGRAQHGSRDPEARGRDDRSQARKPSVAQDRPRSEDWAAPAKFASKSTGTKRHPEQARSRDDAAAAGYKAGGGSYWIYGDHAVLAAIDNPKRRIRRLLQANPDAEKAARGGTERTLPQWE